MWGGDKNFVPPYQTKTNSAAACLLRPNTGAHPLVCCETTQAGGRKKKNREIAPLRRVSSQEERGVIKRSEGKEWKEERHRSTFGRERNATFAPRVLSTLKPLSKVMGVNRGGRRAVETDGGVKGRQREK